MISKDDQKLREALGTLDTDVRAPDDLKLRVMERVMASGERSAVLTFFDTLLRPRTMTVRPAYGLGLVAALLAALTLWPVTDGMPNPTDAGKVPTHFVLMAPDVQSVSLTGDFTSWASEGIALRDVNGSGLWVADVDLDPGVYQYVFIVNGQEWRPDPGASAQVDDGFGQVNSVVMVSPDAAPETEGRT